MAQTITILALILGVASLAAQQPTLRTIAFYNVENLFDIQDDSLVFDEARTPGGSYHWTEERYDKKIESLAVVISRIGWQERQAAPDLLGICEVENATVLQDLVVHPLLRSSNYGILHQDSPDERGIDVALLYKADIFQPTAFASRSLILLDKHLHRDRTRDQLVITGWLDETFIGIIVNHWPSRRGGQTRSEPYRLQAAQLNRTIIDSLRTEHPDIFIFNMGDFNDNPSDVSMRYVIKPNRTQQPDLFNPMWRLFQKGYGTLAYRDQWSLFDQILIDTKVSASHGSSLCLHRIGIYNPPKLVTPRGRYKGYPFSTYSGGRYQGGVSDHFPVYIILKKCRN